MNILLFPRILAKTGVGNYVKMLAEELTVQGHNVVVVSGTKELELNEKVKFVSLPVTSNNPVRILNVIRKLHKIARDYNIQIVHCHHRKTALIMKLYNICYRMPFVYTLHSTNIPNDFVHRKLTFVGKQAIATSNDVRKSLINELGISANKITNIPNGVKIITVTNEQVEECKKRWNLPRNKYILTMHSRIDRIKNHLLMVEAVNKLSEKAKSKIVVVCSGEKKGEYYEKVARRIDELGLNEIFRFVGWSDTQSVLGVSDFLFLPSFKEGFPLSVVEAFFLKVPVARTKTAGFEEQKFCLPIDMNDPQPIVNIIEDLVENGKQQYSERIESAYNLALEEFTVEVMTAKNVKVYEEVCKK